MSQMYNPCHPGEILLEEYVKPLNLTVTKAAKLLGIGRQALSALVSGRAGVSVPMAMKLAKACNTSPQLWLNMQQQYDLWQAQKSVDTSKVKRFPKLNPRDGATA